MHVIHPGVDAETFDFYEWSCSPLDANNSRYTLPDLGYGDDENVASMARSEGLSTGASNVAMPIPSTLNCSGTVTAVEFCYFRVVRDSVIEYGTEYPLLTLLTLEQNNTFTFTVTNRINISSTPTPEICTDVIFDIAPLDVYRYCCDSMELNVTDHFNLPAPNFAIGMSSTFQLLQPAYRLDSRPEFRVEQYSNDGSASSEPLTEDTFTLSRLRTQQTLRLFQFVISK